MTKTKTKSHRVPVYRRPLFIIFVLLVIAAGAIIAFFIFNQAPSTEPNLTAPEPSAPELPAPDRQPDEETPEEPERPAQFEGEDPNKIDTLTGQVAYRGIDSSRNVLSITASIDQYLSSGGNCHLSLYRANTEIYSADLSALPDITTSVCGPFEVPLSRLSSGTYNIIIKVTADDKSGTITSEVGI